MKFIANTVYEYRALVEDEDNQLFLLLKMIEYEERETYLENFSQRHHIECYILIIMGRLCKADPERLDDLFGDTETLRRLIKKVVRNIRSVIVVKDKEVSVGILMLLSLILKSEKMEELRDDLLSTLCGIGSLVECMNYSYRLFSLIAYADLFLAQARCEFIADSKGLS